MDNEEYWNEIMKDTAPRKTSKKRLSYRFASHAKLFGVPHPPPQSPPPRLVHKVGSVGEDDVSHDEAIDGPTPPKVPFTLKETNGQSLLDVAAVANVRSINNSVYSDIEMELLDDFEALGLETLAEAGKVDFEIDCPFPKIGYDRKRSFFDSLATISEGEEAEIFDRRNQETFGQLPELGPPARANTRGYNNHSAINCTCKFKSLTFHSAKYKKNSKRDRLE